MPSPFQVRARIADLEEEERQLYNADRHFWENPEHTPEAHAAYNRRREQIRKVRQELDELHRLLAIETVRAARA
jgi:hypothetical protein